MGTPAHGLFCQSWTYPTKCWYCRAPIFVYGCSCGSVVLFDHLGAGWPEHVCGKASLPPGPILSDGEWERWRFREHMVAIQPGREQWVSVPPAKHRQHPPRHFVATLQDLPNPRTRRIASLLGEGPFELARLKMVAGANYVQITLRDTATAPHQVYPAIVRQSNLPAGLRPNMRFGVTLEARGLRRAEWFVVEIVALPETRTGESVA